MGFLILLRFVLLCIDFLAWPVLALGFPLFASIRAIETGSVYHMRKLITYWTLFSIISLFEYTFVIIIEWIPFWSSIKLVAIFWLVIPRFRGAYYAYQSFVRPFLLVNLREIIDNLCKLKEEQTRAKERFLDLAEKYIQENGSEAFEKLISTKKDAQVVIQPDEKNVAAAPKPINEPDAAQKDEEMLEAREIRSPEAKQKNVPDAAEKDEEMLEAHEIRSNEAKQINETDAAEKDEEMLEAYEIRSPEAKQVPHPRLLTTTTTTTALRVPKETTYAAAKTKGVTITPSPLTIGSENRLTTSPLKKVEPDMKWHCPLCQVTCTCEIAFKSHLQGQKHLKKLKQNRLKIIRAQMKWIRTDSEMDPSKNLVKNQFSTARSLDYGTMRGCFGVAPHRETTIV